MTPKADAAETDWIETPCSECEGTGLTLLTELNDPSPVTIDCDHCSGSGTHEDQVLCPTCDEPLNQGFCTMCAEPQMLEAAE